MMDETEIPKGHTLDPESVTTTKIWSAWATIGLGLATGLLFVSAQAVVLICFLAVKIASEPTTKLLAYTQTLTSNGLVVALSTIVSAIVGMASIIVFIRIHPGTRLSEYLGFRRISWKTVAGIMIVLVFTFAVIIGLETLYNTLVHSIPAESVNSSFMRNTYTTAGWLPLLWVAVVGFAPVFEEAFFRGFLFVGLQNSRLGSVGTILFTSLLWASLHLQYNIVGMATIVALGIVLGVTRLKTRSLWSPILIHSFWNLIAMAGTAVSLHG
jgi:uncharacterized protein